MKKVSFALVLAAFAFVCCNGFATKKNAVKSYMADKEPPKENIKANKKVLLELFTSQGCSSCPSADKLLKKLTADTNIIALAFHVDYWNRLGWKDPFSDAKYSARQQYYSNKLHAEMYTPQTVINGKFEAVGSNETAIQQYIEKEKQTNSSVEIFIDEIKNDGKKMAISFHVNGENSDLIYYAGLVQQSAITNIKAGENNGVKLENTNIVRSIASTENVSENLMLDIPVGLMNIDYKILLFAQNKTTGQVLAVAEK